MRFWPLIFLVLLLATAVKSDGIDNGKNGQRMGLSSGINNFTTSAAPAQCASPNAPDGHVDLSKCSNAFYFAVIF